MKRLLLLFFIVSIFALTGCKKNDTSDPNQQNDDQPQDLHKCTNGHWVWEEGAKCNTKATAYLICDECGELMDYDEKWLTHNMVETEYEEPTCLEEGKIVEKCSRCGYKEEDTLPATGHQHLEYEILIPATETTYGTRRKYCKDCETVFRSVTYAANGFSVHGKLSVSGADLVDANGKKFQLIGLSTHGLQWAESFVTYDTLESLRNSFGINVYRFSLYPEEGGYSECSESYKEHLYQVVVKGINLCTQLDMYAVIDWHMLGDNFHTDDAAEFFARISEEFKDNDNILFEIMNEPYGDKVTWSVCKAYANKIIPIIRKNSNGIILVGNPHWSADLQSVMNSPLTGYENIMYTYHFYAGSGANASEVKKAYGKGIPVFISEHGGMNSDGDGPISYSNIAYWHKTLDEYNISYIAWNISNTQGSASIFKHMTGDKVSTDEANLKEWGNYYKSVTRKRFGLPEDEDDL